LQDKRNRAVVDRVLAADEWGHYLSFAAPSQKSATTIGPERYRQPARSCSTYSVLEKRDTFKIAALVILAAIFAGQPALADTEAHIYFKNNTDAWIWVTAYRQTAGSTFNGPQSFQADPKARGVSRRASMMSAGCG
jgi:hypothetical protein